MPDFPRAPQPDAEPNVTAAAQTRARVEHVAAKLATLTIGAAYVSPGAAAIRRWRDRHSLRPVFPGRVALVAHVYYTHLIGEILDCYATLPTDADLIVTAPPDRLADLGKALAGVERARLIGAPNRGRDVAPFLALLNDGALAAYDALLKIHTKRSPHLRDGDIRRRLLFTTLAGSYRHTARALALFKDRATGLVGWGPSWRSSIYFWMRNRSRVDELAAGMDVGVSEAPAFFEGSMFWVRPAALERLRALNLTADQFETEAGQKDGALHHAVERAFSLAALAGGYVVRDLRGRRLFGTDRPWDDGAARDDGDARPVRN